MASLTQTVRKTDGIALLRVWRCGLPNYNVVTQHAQRNVDQAQAHVQQCHVAHSNCGGKWLCWTTQLLQFFEFQVRTEVGCSKCRAHVHVCNFLHKRTLNLLRESVLGCNWMSDYDNRRIFGAVNNAARPDRRAGAARSRREGAPNRRLKHRFPREPC